MLSWTCCPGLAVAQDTVVQTFGRGSLLTSQKERGLGFQITFKDMHPMIQPLPLGSLTSQQHPRMKNKFVRPVLGSWCYGVEGF